ncbi:hypothetical protein JHK82_014635 [Glycine max]|uniref:DDT domain-containing protein n=2 Tax=Glycine subgen. Soja TaxID=1462606 RepID=A0A0R0JIJ0_SOYBN|nr:hypothetical protein JHK85_015002 [Glycine max]KAG5045250.1 hypothetical protein JHK86_014656 [Glycine max]KAG5147754.1 hypothetical protein JHK82_014635 [Glycine max]RZC06269.1 DDT domain-containing protein DDR4 [Glycine soja]
MQAVEEGGGEERNARFEESDLDSEISKLRGRWELASVLNFLDVFGPILGKDLKLSAEDIEIGLVKPDTSLSRLHIQLLKGIPPVSKTLEDSDKWVTAPCKNLTAWWLCVAEGEIPLISKYKEPDPSDCLLLLKALCEVRAQQHGAVYDATSKGQSHRLYREIITSDSIPNDKDEGCLSLPTIQWETLASNLEDFSKVAEKFAFSKCAAEVAVSLKLQDDAIPALEKLRKKKERAIKQKQRQDMLLKKDFQNPHYSGNTRSCHARRPISYTFEAYDRTMKEAIQLTNKRTKFPVAEQDKSGGSENKSNTRYFNRHDDTGYKVENHGSSEEDAAVDGELGNLETPSSHAVFYPKGFRCCKQKPRQRPTRNSAMESVIVSDSEDEAREGKRDLSEST